MALGEGVGQIEAVASAESFPEAGGNGVVDRTPTGFDHIDLGKARIGSSARKLIVANLGGN